MLGIFKERNKECEKKKRRFPRCLAKTLRRAPIVENPNDEKENRHSMFKEAYLQDLHYQPHCYPPSPHKVNVLLAEYGRYHLTPMVRAIPMFIIGCDLIPSRFFVENANDSFAQSGISPGDFKKFVFWGMQLTHTNYTLW